MSILEDYKKWKIDNPDEGYQYDMVHDFFDSYGRGDLQNLLEIALKLKTKADKWDKLDAEISKFYEGPDYEDGGEGDLCDIGEIAAMHLGYL